jgi:hypothetical protein
VSPSASEERRRDWRLEICEVVFVRRFEYQDVMAAAELGAHDRRGLGRGGCDCGCSLYKEEKEDRK